jgi:hypothetical protein
MSFTCLDVLCTVIVPIWHIIVDNKKLKDAAYYLSEKQCVWSVVIPVNGCFASLEYFSSFSVEEA